MRSWVWRQWSGFAAILAGVVGILYAPFHAAAYLATEDGGSPVLPWDEGFRDAFPSAFDFDDPQSVYIAYGQVLPFVLLGMFLGLLGLQKVQGPSLGPKGKWAFRVLATANAVLILGVIGEYYTPYLDESFLLAGPAVLATIASSVWYGIVTLKARVVPRGAAWLLTAGGPAVIALVALLGHIPLGFSVLYVAWIWIGSFLVSPGPAVARP